MKLARVIFTVIMHILFVASSGLFFHYRDIVSVGLMVFTGIHTLLGYIFIILDEVQENSAQ